MHEASPWVEKYRPKGVEGIVMDSVNRAVFSSITSSGKCPHLLLHGPPGTGKTTAAINLTRKLMESNGGAAKERVIHLNASDERGVDTIRKQIAKFVGTKNLFSAGRKFIILDEVDYMTRCAQTALRHLVQEHETSRLCFFLICNYVTRIEPGLRAEFVLLRFDSPPAESVNQLLHQVCLAEGLDLPSAQIEAIRLSHGGDIRSMINCLQVKAGCSESLPSPTADFWEAVRSGFARKRMDGRELCRQASEAGMSMNEFSTALLNHLVRSGDVDNGGALLILAKGIANAREGDDAALASFIADGLHAVLGS